MDILKRYIKLANKGKWTEALPLIEEIVNMNVNISTSWFNYGVCLEALERDQNAVNAFIKAYEIDPEDYKCQFRIFRSLVKAKNNDGFYEFLDKEYKIMPEIIELLEEYQDFNEIINDSRFEKYKTM